MPDYSTLRRFWHDSCSFQTKGALHAGSHNLGLTIGGIFMNAIIQESSGVILYAEEAIKVGIFCQAGLSQGHLEQISKNQKKFYATMNKHFFLALYYSI